jgi:hypothetical protein
MSKSKFFTGQPIFAQLLSYTSQSRINQIATEYQADRYYKDFKTYTHLVTLLYGIYNRCESLREVATGLQAWEHRVHHLGLNYHPRKSTISDANINRCAEVFEAIYKDLYCKYRNYLPDSRSKKKASRLFIADSTTISLFQEILKNAGQSKLDGRRKGGLKVHTLIRSDEDVPCLVRFTAGAAADVSFLKSIHLPEGSILVMDRGYVNDYRQLNRLNKEKITWISRLRRNSVYRILENKSVSSEQSLKGVRRDMLIELGHTHSKRNTRTKARLIEYIDAKTGKKFEFLTNSKRLANTTVADYYRQRWQIEILFKRIKQNYPLSRFMGDTENAIKIQIWGALIADLILKVVKAGAGKNWSFSNLASTIRLHLMTYIDLFSFLRNPEKALITKSQTTPQYGLFSP